MNEFVLLLLGNSFGMMIANVVSIVLMGMLSWFVFENCLLPERFRLMLVDTTFAIPNAVILQLYLFFCMICLILF